MLWTKKINPTDWPDDVTKFIIVNHTDWHNDIRFIIFRNGAIIFRRWNLKNRCYELKKSTPRINIVTLKLSFWRWICHLEAVSVIYARMNNWCHLITFIDSELIWANSEINKWMNKFSDNNHFKSRSFQLISITFKVFLAFHFHPSSEKKRNWLKILHLTINIFKSLSKRLTLK